MPRHFFLDSSGVQAGNSPNRDCSNNLEILVASIVASYNRSMRISDKAILCVDDERTVLIGLRDQIAKHFGDLYRYETAESADEAWEVIEELNEEGVRILIIVSDWLMPGIRGDEFLIEIHQRFPAIVTVLLTGHADEAAIERARQQANLHACIVKPWNEDHLIEVIRSGLRTFE
jgi:CheY-like chemotaxis protein